MNITELYFQVKTRYDSVTAWLSKYLYGEQYLKHRLIFNVFVVASSIIAAAIYGAINGDYYYLKIGAIFGVVDIITISIKLVKAHNKHSHDQPA